MLRPIFRPILGTMARALTQGGLRSRYLGPSLDLNFAANTYLRGAIDQVPTPQAFGSVITFTRASGGGRINAAGVYEWVGNDVPRLTHDPITLQPLGIIIEEQRTNLLLNSVLAGGTSGTVGAGAVAPTSWSFSAPAPSGEVTFLNTSLGAPGVRFQAVTQRPSIQRFFSAQANTTYYHHAKVTSLDGNIELQDCIAAANIPSGTSVSYWRNGAVVASNTPVAAGDHIAAVIAIGANAGNVAARIGAGAQTNATCDITMTMPQVEAGLPSSFIPTEASQVTRAADVCSVNTLSPWFNAVEGTLVIDAACGPGTAALQIGAAITDGSNNNYMSFLMRNASSIYRGMTVRTDNVEVAAINPTAQPFGRIKCAGSYKENSFSASFNGVAPVTDTSGAVPAVDRLVVGRLIGGSHFNGTISRITYYPRVIDVQQASA